MSRILAELLGAREVAFRSHISQLEQASGLPHADVSLTAEVLQLSHQKLKQLSLDPHDTHGPELYAALKSRFMQDNSLLERRFADRFGASDEEPNSMTYVHNALQQLPLPQHCLALKSSVIKRLLKSLPPKTVMKQLGYRSLDSMLKHEPAAVLLTVSNLVETAKWRKGVQSHYRNLQATDFETRPLAVHYLSDRRWTALTNQLVSTQKQTIFQAKESAEIVLIPFGATKPPGALLTSLVLGIQAINEIRSASSYLKLHLVRPDFGEALHRVADGDPLNALQLLNEPISWQLVQRFYARFKDVYRHELFEPHLAADDFSWLPVEYLLSKLEPNLGFWQATGHVGVLHGKQAVSFNIQDAARNFCNNLPFEHRNNDHFQQSLWQELLLRYIKPVSIERAITKHMQTEVAFEPALA